MEEIIKDIEKLAGERLGLPVEQIVKLPQSGSDRIYFRVFTDTSTFIATYGRNTRENRTFLYFSEHFRSRGCPVPHILVINDLSTLYIQEDLGDTSLLNKLEESGLTEEVYDLFRASLKQLAHMQIAGDRGLDYGYCITSREFGEKAIMSDLLYFKYYFLDTLQQPYDKEQLLEEFEQFSRELSNTGAHYFMFRDFQSRNIMIRDNEIYFIDYQGGMKGALQYDVASLLWQARAGLPDQWKSGLLNEYLHFVEECLGAPVNRTSFIEQYHGYVLIRLLQVLGAYGFRGLFERKAHFLTSIPPALMNLRQFLGKEGIPGRFKEFGRLLQLIVDEEVMNRFQPVQATPETPLVVYINSFSYKKGIPSDASGNGGGFVFDCRGVLNPGRFEEYKKLTGRDKAVEDFLEQRTKMNDFLNSIFTIVDISVEEYIKRGFRSLQVSFGCTGGQHRSVFAADRLARHLRNKYKVNVQLHHVEQDAKNWINI